ncbi:epoxide hydrolase [Streptomyces europaeiscabiei]|uniref:epoxide hydrolase family protein n=1 Tax=Streptomyces europaeiscabiei TaxID=146819 RepID=UPI002E2CAEA2|nr:epoxide hydrolase [Streptomyces europaeiscabiei]
MAAGPEIRPFRIDIPQTELDDLEERLARTRWPKQLPGDGFDRGVPVAAVRELAEYWRTKYDWRAQERRLNEFPQFMTEIDGLDVHFLHVRSPRPDAVPLLLSHGWPNSVVEFTRLIGPLTERGFHVVAPSVPGFAFSEGPREVGFGIDDVARMWAELMRRLGYDRYGTQGGDLGAYLAPAVARTAPEHAIGVHINGGFGFPAERDVPELTEAERAHYEMIKQWSDGGVDHHTLLRFAPQTFAYAWNDSPVAQLTWMMQKFEDFLIRDYDRDLFLTNVALYWLTGTSGTSSWFMYNRREFVWPQGQQHVPTGVYCGPPAIRRLAERDNRIVHWPESNPGSHFVAMDEPVALATDVRAFFDRIL